MGLRKGQARSGDGAYIASEGGPYDPRNSGFWVLGCQTGSMVRSYGLNRAESNTPRL